MTLLLALLLSLSLVLPADAQRFEWVRALHRTPRKLAIMLATRMMTTLAMAGALAAGTTAWAEAAPLGRHMLVFAGVMTAFWLWMWFWMRTYVADPDQPVPVLEPVSVVLGSVLSLTLWLTLFTLQAVMAAWINEITWGRMWGVAALWAALDALWIALLAWYPAGYRHIQSEHQQRRVSRVGGSIVMLIAIWAVFVVFA